MQARLELVHYKDLNIIISRTLKAKQTVLKVKKDKITVSTSLFESTERIMKFVESREEFIRKALYRINNGRKQAIMDFNESSSWHFMGEPCKTVVTEASRGFCRFENGVLYLQGPSETARKNAFKKFAQDVLDELLDRFRAELSYPVGDYTLKYRFYTSRWGCCIKNPMQGRREIVMNLWCVAMEPEAIRYIFYHELSHLKVSNHQKEFYSHLAQLYPDYKKGLKLSKQYML